MAVYAYKCVNEKCKEKDVEKSVSMSMAEYSEEKLPICKCGEKTRRVFTPTGHQTFGDGYKS
jgi:predicted nucleic acid-binding Zn ribbon protein